MTAYTPRVLNLEELEYRPILEDMSVVIPTLGRTILQESLHWILCGSAWPMGLIVVDQGVNPQVAAWMSAISELGINTDYIPSSQRGRAAGVNRGLERVKTQFVAITDDDCFVEKDWLKNMVGHLWQHPEAIVTGRVEAGTDDVIVVVTSQVPSVQHKPNLTFDHMSGGNMGTSKVVLQKVGLFDEDPCLQTAEDGEFAYRALRAGVSIYYEPDVCVRHFGWRSEGDRLQQYRGYAKSHGGFYGKYLRQGDIFIAFRVVGHHARALRRWWRGFWTGDQETAQYGRAYVTGLLPGIMTGIKQKTHP